jgi:hypothetical protein
MKARVGNNEATDMVGANGEAALNNNGKKLIDFCTVNNLKIINTFFKHKEIHQYTCETRGHKLIIDYFTTEIKKLKGNTRY